MCSVQVFPTISHDLWADILHIAFMFNDGHSPVSIFSPICIQICTGHLQLIHSNRINHELYSEPSFPAPKLYLLRHTLGYSHYIVWSTRSSDMVKLCPTRKKTLTFHSFFLFLPPTYTKNKGFYFQKLHKSIWNLLFFNRKTNFLTFFLFFPPTRVKIQIFIFIFFPPTKHKTPLSELVDQTIY